jgi:outer membrane protein OmpA-like peptidoglycan-associated protein
MKKFLSLLLLISAFAAGCKKKDKVVVKDSRNNKKVEMPLASNKDRKNSFFDEHVEAFVLEDEFDKNDKVNVAIVDKTVSWVEESEEAAKGFKPVYFDFDRFSVRADQQPVVERDIDEAKQLVAHGNSVVVEGHACHSAGSKSYNLLISEHRAQEIAQKLEHEGVNKNKLKVVARGTEMPVVLGGDRNEQAPNRRVEMFSIQA